MTGNGVIYRQAAVGVQAGGNYKGKHGKTRSQDHTGQRRSAADKCQSGPIDPRKKNGQNAARESHHRCDDGPAANTSGQAANRAPPAVINQTWLPSQVGPMALIITRR